VRPKEKKKWVTPKVRRLRVILNPTADLTPESRIAVGRLLDRARDFTAAEKVKLRQSA
jgi:hypothetical protein